MSQLPVEIIFAILEQIYYRYPNNRRFRTFREPDYNTLSACSLISSAWRSPAQSLLFNHITQDAAPRLMYTARYLMDCKLNHIWEKLLKHIRILDVFLSQDTSLEPPKTDRNPYCSPNEFIDLMKHCTNLYELNVCVSGIFSLQPILTDLQSSTYPSRLRALRIGRCSVQSPILYELLQFFPTIQFLAVEVEIVAPPPFTPNNVQLYELAMFRTLRSEICEWLLSGSRDSLRILEMRDLPSVAVSELLQEYGPRLESFRTMKYNYKTAKFVQSCTSLRELVILGLPAVPPLRVNVLSSTLEHLSLLHYHSDPSVDISDVVMLVEKLPNLRLLSSDARFRDDPFYGEFQEICVKRGIQVDTTTYVTWPNEEPVKVVSFPRGRSPVNFRAMNQDCQKVHV
ncbi:hypothetical protein GYMLUDRAFT_77960 [Collybiopsis luxurians FD-317 M1]|uniref:F-box domain-containing protein n=1 Tax=Collybiopsis luxurians FD-317 M1 TaxID=944289 RepID=A0A0D0BCB5_9AGAR|nr:hypothetical protein GYMLUDRAFT_77960 [Collybiopsis luxurians FD-317 M1]